MKDTSSEEFRKKNTISSTKRSKLHGPSLAIGAGISIVSVIAAFFAMGIIDNEHELEFEEKLPSQESQEITIDLFTSNGSPPLGDKNAPITLVEFGDYQCHFCNVFYHETEDSILKNYVDTGKVKMIFKDFTIIGTDSVTAAHAAHCASEQGKFWEYHDILYNNWTGENNGWASSENLIKFAQAIDLEQDSFLQCMQEGKYQQTVEKSKKDGITLGITGTPAFFVISSDGSIVPIKGAQPYEYFEQVFETMLER